MTEPQAQKNPSQGISKNPSQKTAPNPSDPTRPSPILPPAWEKAGFPFDQDVRATYDKRS